MTKPKITIHLDIDGLLFAHYGTPECFQLRPGVNSFLEWAVKNFECRWLTCWPTDEIQSLMKLLYCRAAKDIRTSDSWRESSHKTTEIDPKEPWIWIDDAPTIEEIKVLDIWEQTDRLVLVNPCGADELERVKGVLQTMKEQYNKTGHFTTEPRPTAKDLIRRTLMAA